MIDRAPSAAERLPGVADLPPLAGLPDEVRAVVVGSLELLPFAFGEELVSEGDAPDGLYFILEGAARVVKMADGGQEVALNVLGPGDSFGEIGLLGARPRTATVRASSEVVALRMHRTTAISLATTYPELRVVLDQAGRRYELLGFLRSRSELRSLPLAVINDLLDAVEEAGAAPSEIVMREGDRPDALYLVLEGRLRATSTGDSLAPDGYLRAGDVFGEAALLTGAPRIHTVEALGDCRLLRLRADAFQQLSERHPVFRKAMEECAASYQHRRIARVPLDFAEEPCATPT